MFLTWRMQNCTFRIDCSRFVAWIRDGGDGLQRGADCFMVGSAPVTRSWQAGFSLSGRGTDGGDRS
jgi:hypothetical protein